MHGWRDPPDDCDRAQMDERSRWPAYVLTSPAHEKNKATDNDRVTILARAKNNSNFVLLQNFINKYCFSPSLYLFWAG